MTTNERALAAPAGQQLYDFDLNDFGVQPDYSKEFLNGKVLIIHGISEAAFEGEFDKPARSLLHSWPQDFYATDGRQDLSPYGALLSEDSPAIRQASDMQRKGSVPFVARLVQNPSKAHRGQSYWTLERVPSFQFNESGELIDPNAPEPQPSGKGASK